MHRAWESNETRTHSALSHNNNGISCTYKQTLYLCVGGGVRVKDDFVALFLALCPSFCPLVAKLGQRPGDDRDYHF